MKHFTKAAALTVLLMGAACNSEKADGSATGSGAPARPVAAPNGGDWTKMVRPTEQGGFMMGNPNAAVKLVEFGSMTCPHCAEFAKLSDQALIDKYVKSGRVSFEFRNFVRDPYDLSASLITRCGGAKSFFPLTHAMFADQQKWVEKLQAVPQQHAAETLQGMAPPQQMKAIADWAGFQQWAAQRGLPSTKTSACLANQGEIQKLVQMNADAVAGYNIPGTPAFLINGALVEDVATWEALEPKLKKALGG